MAQLKNVYYDPLSSFGWIKIINIKHEILYEVDERRYGMIPQLTNDYLISQHPQIKNIYNICKELNIKFLVSGQDIINGMSLKILFEEE